MSDSNRDFCSFTESISHPEFMSDFPVLITKVDELGVMMRRRDSSGVRIRVGDELIPDLISCLDNGDLIFSETGPSITIEDKEGHAFLHLKARGLALRQTSTQPLNIWLRYVMKTRGVTQVYFPFEWWDEMKEVILTHGSIDRLNFHLLQLIHMEDKIVSAVEELIKHDITRSCLTFPDPCGNLSLVTDNRIRYQRILDRIAAIDSFHRLEMSYLPAGSTNTYI